MALYEFVCHECKVKFEERLSMSEVSEAEVLCPECSKPATRFYGSISFRIVPANETAAKKAGLSMDNYEKAKSQREAKKKEERHSSEDFNKAVDSQLNNITQRGI